MDLTPPVVVLWVALAWASVTDVRTGLIKNWLTFSLMAFGIVYHAIVGPDRLFGLVGWGAATALHFALFALTINKAGDSKLFMAIGACVGAQEMVEATIWYFLLYIPLGFVTLATMGRLTNFVRTVGWMFRSAMGLPVEEKPEPTWMIAGPTIFAAAVLAGATDTVREWVFG